MNHQNLEKQVHYFSIEDPGAPFAFANALRSLIKHHRRKEQPLVLLCIGTDRATGDCLGPLLGYKLRSIPGNFHIFGDLDYPVHAKNLTATLAEIQKKYCDPFIIAVDASLGEATHVGYFTLSTGPLHPGAGVNKALPPVGHLCITGIVDYNDSLRQMQLQTTRLQLVMALADSIFLGICRGIPSKMQNKSSRTKKNATFSQRYLSEV